ncbi:MAG: hypothetical protein GY778_31805 [bacterium]|nr:hypothetical protein [bacterium]
MFNPIPPNLYESGHRWIGYLFWLARWLIAALAVAVLIACILYWRNVEIGSADPAKLDFLDWLWALSRELVASLSSAAAGDQQVAASPAVQPGSQPAADAPSAGLTTLVLALFAGGGKLLESLLSAAKSVGSYVRNPGAQATSGSLSRVRDQLGKLIKHATPPGSRFVIFLDDLERCRPPKAVDVLEAVNQLLNHENVVTVVMADLPAVAACVEIKYEKLAQKMEGYIQAHYGRHYLQKIVQLQFDLPEKHEPQRIKNFLDHLGEAEPGQDESANVLPRLVETCTRVFDFAWSPEAKLSQPLNENRQRWPGLGRLAWLVWLIALPALALGKWGVALICRAEHRKRYAPPAGRTLGTVATGLLVSLWTLGIVLAAITAALALRFSRIGPLPVWSGWIASLALPGSTVLMTLRAIVKRWRDRKRTERLGKKLEEVRRKRAEEGQPAAMDPDELVAEATAKDPDLAQFAKGKAGQDVVQENHLHHLGEKSDLLKEAEDVATPHLATIPRHLKRNRNRLRLLLFVADRRGMLAEDDKLQARRLGKWAALQERWPELAFRLLRDPTIQAELESAAGRPGQEFCAAVGKRLGREYAADTDLKDFCVPGPDPDPELGPVMEKLVQFEPMPVGTDEGGTPPTA